MFSALAFLLSSVILPLVWHHRRQYDQRLSRSLELVTQAQAQFREYQTQRNYNAHVSRNGFTDQCRDIHQQYLLFQQSAFNFAQWTQPWFSVGVKTLQLSVNRLLTQHVTARRSRPELAIDLSEAEQETQVFTQLADCRYRLLHYSYLQYIKDQLL